MTAGIVRHRHRTRLEDVAAALLAVMLAAGLLLRFYHLGTESLWLDELWTAATSDPSLTLGQWLNHWVLKDVHPPLYALLMREWQLAFGNSEFSLRLPSALASLALVASVPLVQRWTPVLRAPLVLAAWLACSVGAILYAREARAYALLLLSTTVATLLGVAIAARLQRGEPVRGAAWLLAGIVTIAEYSHYFGALAGAGLFGALLLFAAGQRRSAIPGLLLPGLVAVAVLLPWLVFHAAHVAGKTGGNFWITNNWKSDFGGAATFLAGSPAASLIVAAAAAAVLVTRPHLLRAPDCFVPLVSMVLILLGAVAVSLHTPVITERNLLILLPPFYVLATAVAADVASDRHGGARIGAHLAMLLVVAGNLAFAVHQVATSHKDDWRAAAAEVAALPGCGGAPLQVYFWPAEIYAYYLPSGYRGKLRPVALDPSPYIPPRRLRQPAGRCPLILWSGHMVAPALVGGIARRLGFSRQRIVVRRTQGNMLLLDRRRLQDGAATGPARR
ncbi:MAG TPA: glycosyltransferase family 39 protein [Alphaproteobacteria bacterium]|jgi:uncharacterized membrane protein|nr:glycosyltransferase family 39 protein [Alphaproteobacteria bacterium]